MRLPGFSRRKAEPTGGSEPPPRPPRPPTPGQLRRERRALIRSREDRIRDLGGIILEMYKRDRFNQELVAERCDELVSLERRLQEVDGILARAAVARRAPAGSTPCVCGAPIVPGSHFCGNCGRPVGDAPVVACPQCGAPLPAEALFCGRCGSPTAEPAANPTPPQPETSEPEAEAASR